MIAAAMLLLAIGCGVPAPAPPGVPRFRVAWVKDVPRVARWKTA